MTSNKDLFPNSFVEQVISRLKELLQTDQVFPRSLGINEGNDAIGVFVASWQPLQDSKEMGFANQEFTLSRYVIRVQNLRIDGDEIEGRRAFNVTCRKIRAILARDPQLQLSLGGLAEDLLGTVERVKKYDVVRQEFMNARLTVGTTYLCTTEVQIETESTRL